MKFISITPENNNASEFISITNAMPSFVKLYSPSCGHCVAMQKAWDSLKNNPALKNYNMAVIEVHANELDKINSPAMSVNGGFPTIRKVLKMGKLGKFHQVFGNILNFCSAFAERGSKHIHHLQILQSITLEKP